MFSSNVVFKELVLRSLLKGFAVDKSFFHALSGTEGEMRVLKCLGQFKVRADVKDGIYVSLCSIYLLHSVCQGGF